MKKICYLFCLIFMLFLSIDVNASAQLDGDESVLWPFYPDGEINKNIYSSGKKVVMKINVNASDFYSTYDGERQLLSKQRVQNIKVNITNSSNVSCTITNLKKAYYKLDENVFTLKDTNATAENVEGDAGEISCTLPTTNDFIEFSTNNYITVVLESTDVDYIGMHEISNESLTYKIQFGVLNENYVYSLNDKTSIVSATVDGKESGTKINDIDKDKVTLKVTQNALASKNKLYLSASNEKNEEFLSKRELKTSEQEISLPYGGIIIELEELTERQLFMNRVRNNDYSLSFVGFSNGFSNYSTESVNFLFNRIDNRSKVNTLKSLIISDVNISFKPELKNYVATVPYKVSSVNINSILTDSKSSYVSGFGNRTVNLNEGVNTVLVKVKAENDAVATYTIKITREKNDDSSLKSINVNGKIINVQSGLLVYSTNVNNDVVKPTIKAAATDSKAKISVEKFGELKEGENEITITVTASNGAKSIYVLKITRDRLISTNSKLKKLEAKGYQIDFDSEKTEYNIYINYDVDKIDLIVEPEHEKAKYIVSGNKDLENGSLIKIKVTAEDETTITTYTINIEKAEKPFNYLLVIIPGIILLLIIIILLVSKKKKNNLNNESIKNNTYSQNVDKKVEEDNIINLPKKDITDKQDEVINLKQEDKVGGLFEPKIKDVSEITFGDKETKDFLADKESITTEKNVQLKDGTRGLFEPKIASVKEEKNNSLFDFTIKEVPKQNNEILDETEILVKKKV